MRFGIAFVLGATSFLVGCAQAPVEELGAYREAFAQARTAGDLVLDEVAPLVASSKPQSPARDGCALDHERGYRTCFDVALALGPAAARRNEPKLIRVRRLALEQIDGYNALLVALAEGRSAEALTQRIDAVLGAAKAAASLSVQFGGVAVAGGVTLAQMAVASFNPIITKLEVARGSNAAATSVLAARSDIDAIIEFLISETPDYYALFLLEHKAALDILGLDFDDAEDEEDDQSKALAKEIGKRLAMAQDVDHPGNPARAFETALTAYVQLLDTSRNALATLDYMIRQPMESRASALNQITRQTLVAETFVVEVKDAMARFRANDLR